MQQLNLQRGSDYDLANGRFLNRGLGVTKDETGTDRRFSTSRSVSGAFGGSSAAVFHVQIKVLGLFNFSPVRNLSPLESSKSFDKPHFFRSNLNAAQNRQFFRH
jgi:hypothetical protein